VIAVNEDDHDGVQCTLHRLRCDFHFPDMRHVVQDFVRACDTCQWYKFEHLHSSGLLLPLPVPTMVWADIGLDFVEALPRVCVWGGGISDPYGGGLLQQVLSLHLVGSPVFRRVRGASLLRGHRVSSRRTSVHGVRLMVRAPMPSTFWRELMRLMGTKLHMMTAFHPQADGQTKAANRVIVMYLRCFIDDRPRQ